MVQGLGSKKYGFKFGFQGSRFRVQGFLNFKVYSLRSISL